jgi:hypothetical protein
MQPNKYICDAHEEAAAVSSNIAKRAWLMEWSQVTVW